MDNLAQKPYIYTIMKQNCVKSAYKNKDLPDLILMAKDGDDCALDELIAREAKNVESTLYHLKANNDDVLDISQDVLLKVSKNISKLKNPQMFKSWLRQITTNQFYDSLRKKRCRISLAHSEPVQDYCTPEIPDHKSNPHCMMMNCELDEIIKKSIDSLAPKFKKVITMREIEGLSYGEIAKATRTSVGTVKSRISRARNKLQELIEPYMDEV